MTLGQKIKKLRVEKGLTQKDLADKVFVTFQTVSKWEKDENEPDVATLKSLAKVFDCSLDYLLSEEENAKPKEDSVAPVVAPSAPAEVKTVVIHQKEMHVCERCKKDIPEDDLVMEDVPHRSGRTTTYTKAYYHKDCLAQTKAEREEAKRVEIKLNASKGKKKSFGWAIFGGVVALVFFLLLFLIGAKEDLAIWQSILFSILLAYATFAAVYCIVSGSYIADVFLWAAGLSIKFPGLIFTWDIEGFIWAIAMKILFIVLGFIIGVFALLFAIALSLALGAVSFPFVLIHNNHINYSDSL